MGNRLVGLILGFAFLSASQLPQDLGFRYKDGKCQNERGEEGYNLFFFGECGDFRGAQLGRIDVSGFDLSGSRFDEAELSEVNFSSSILMGVNFSKTKMESVSFEDARLFDVNLNNSELSLANLAGSQIRRLTSKNSTWRDIDFRFADVISLDLSESRVEDVIFDDSVLKTFLLNSSKTIKLSFLRAEIEDAFFLGTIFKETNMSDAIFSGVKGDGADLRSSLLRNSIWKDADLIESNFKNVKCEDSQFTNSNFRNANLVKTNFSRSKLTNVNFSETDLRSANLSEVEIEIVSWNEAKFNERTELPFDRELASSYGMVLIATPDIAILVDPLFVPRSVIFTVLDIVEPYVEEGEIDVTHLDADVVLSESFFNEFDAVFFPATYAGGKQRAIVDKFKDYLEPFVSRGGTFVGKMRSSSGPSYQNDIFGFSIEYLGSIRDEIGYRSEARGTPFDGIEFDEIGRGSFTDAIDSGTLPVGAMSVFEREKRSFVGWVPYGEGEVIYLQENFQSEPRDPNWIKLLMVALGLDP